MKKEIIIVKCDPEGFHKQRLNEKTFKETKRVLLERCYSEKIFQDIVYLYENEDSSLTYYVKVFFVSDLPYSTLMNPEFISKPFKILLNISLADAEKYVRGEYSSPVPKVCYSCENFEIINFNEEEKAKDVIERDNKNPLNSEFDRVVSTTNFLIKEGKIHSL